jgi:hypothetical protein
MARKGSLEDPSRLGNVMYARRRLRDHPGRGASGRAESVRQGRVMTPEQLRWGFDT